MSNLSIVRDPIPYALTFEGHEAARWCVRCVCRPTLDGGLVLCRECGTVYGTLGDVLRGQPPYRKTRRD